MTPNVRFSPEPLLVYPYLHRNSQCCSCSTVMPGDICFNCGRLSTLLVTPRPPRNSIENCMSANTDPALSQDRQVLRSKPFGPQYDLIETLLMAKENLAQQCSQRRVFDSQLTEIDGLLDARGTLADIHALTAKNTAPFEERAPSSSYGRVPRSSRTVSNSFKAHSICASSSCSQTLRSDSVAVSDGLYEDDMPYRKNLARWLEDMTPSGKSSARLTRRGVDCRLNSAGKSCEWVIFL